jgi:5-methylcytosine-specific restriction endonuclease McrA
LPYKNKEDKEIYNKQYYRDNKEHWKHCQEDKDRISKNRKRWEKTEKGKFHNRRHYFKRKTQERGILNTLTVEEWIDILKQYKFRCAYCGKEFTLFNRETRDHIIPISKGGDNAKENVVPACKSCNSKKSNKIIGGILNE